MTYWWWEWAGRLSAAVNARRRNKQVLVVGKEMHSNKLRQAHQVDNYLGISQIKGLDLAAKYREHALDEGVEIKTDELLNLWAEADGFQGMGKSVFYQRKPSFWQWGRHRRLPSRGGRTGGERGKLLCNLRWDVLPEKKPWSTRK